MQAEKWEDFAAGGVIPTKRMGRFLIMGGKTGYPVSWYTNDKEEGNFMEIEATSADRNLLLEMKGGAGPPRGPERPPGAGAVHRRGAAKKLVLDLAGVTFMDSSGIALILRAQQRMQLLDGSLLVRNVPQQARRVLDAAGIGRLVTIR